MTFFSWLGVALLGGTWEAADRGGRERLRWVWATTFWLLRGARRGGSLPEVRAFGSCRRSATVM